MPAIYPTIYRDAHGEETTQIENDGQTLRMVVRGVEFVSKPFGGFDSFEPPQEIDVGLSSFKFDNLGFLIAATLDIEVPMIIVSEAGTAAAALNVIIDLEGVGSGRVIGDAANPRMTLTYNDQSYASKSGWGAFETEMIQIQRQLPPDTYMKCCFNCAYSGYNPGGNEMWGMYCHRSHKREYLAANDKSQWFRLIGGADEFVQEIHLCPEFERWNGETGCRDPLHRPVINNQ